MSANLTDVDALSRLRQRFGNHVVDALIEARILKVAPLDPDVRAVLDDLLTWEPTDVSSPIDPGPSIPRTAPAQFLSTNLPPGLCAWTHGGDLGTEPQAVPPSGEADAALVTLAVRAYPALVAATDPAAELGGWSPMRLRGLREHALAVEAMRAAPDLKSLWDAAEISTSFGRMSTWNGFYDPAELLVHGSWRLCLLRGKWTPDALREAVLRQVEVVRRAARGESPHVPIFLGFDEARVGDEVEDNDLWVRPYRGALQSWLLSRSDRLDEDGGGFVVERSLPWRFSTRAQESLATDTAPPLLTTSPDTFDEFRHWADCLAVSVSLSSLPSHLRPHEFEHPPARSRRPRLRWVLTADPLYGAVSQHFSQGRRTSEDLSPLVTIDRSVLSRTRNLAAIQEGSTRVAIGRLSASLEEYRRWSDCLIDAVIAWEAMSGDCKDSVTLKVVAVVALLVSSLQNRRQNRSEIQKLYKLRSAIVHGGTRSVTRTQRDAAVVIGLAALRSLVDTYPDLMSRKDRFEALFLDSE